MTSAQVVSVWTPWTTDKELAETCGPVPGLAISVRHQFEFLCSSNPPADQVK